MCQDEDAMDLKGFITMKGLVEIHDPEAQLFHLHVLWARGKDG